MQQVVEREIPLYTIKCYNDCLYRVVKRLFDASLVKAAALLDEEEKPEIVGKFDSALSRAKNLVRELALCNQWDYFVTLTFDTRWDRYDFSGRIRAFLQWVQNENKAGKCIRYLLVPEFHKDGAVHLHALMSGIAKLPCIVTTLEQRDLFTITKTRHIQRRFPDRQPHSCQLTCKDRKRACCCECSFDRSYCVLHTGNNKGRYVSTHFFNVSAGRKSPF